MKRSTSSRRSTTRRSTPTLRYELANGRKLIPRDQQFTTTGGELTLTAV